MKAWRRMAVAALLLLQSAGAWAVAPDQYDALVALFADWRAFQRPVMRDGVPDYTNAAMKAQQRQLQPMRARLDAVDRSRLSLSQRVDWELVSAEMSGLDFDHRVLRPWARDPAFYTVVIDSESDTPLREGPAFPAAIELWRLSFPLAAADAAALGTQLRAIPRILDQARGNLVEGGHDLWWLGIRSQKAQAATLAGLARTLAGPHAELVPDAERARDAVTAFASWLERLLPGHQGSSGVGVENYDWYLRHVERVPFTWCDELVLMERELARATTYLKLAEQRNQGLPRLEPPASAAEGRLRADLALASFLAFLRERRVFTVPDYAAPALAEHLTRFRPPEERDFFDEVALRDPRVMLCHSVHWIDKARLRREPHASPIRREPALYNVWVSRAEGFATAMEELALGAGLFDDSPRSHELVYVMVAQRAARAIASLRVHANEWTVAQAIAFASEATPRGWLRPDGELVHFEQQLYLQQPGYGTSYLTGKALVDELIAERAQHEGEAFDLGRTLDQLFATGMIPVSLARYELTGSPGILMER